MTLQRSSLKPVENVNNITYLRDAIPFCHGIIKTALICSLMKLGVPVFLHLLLSHQTNPPPSPLFATDFAAVHRAVHDIKDGDDILKAESPSQMSRPTTYYTVEAYYR